jgi:hypothetical protein
MADAVVAPDAVKPIMSVVRGFDGGDDGLMAFAAGVFGDVVISWFDLNWIGKVACGERKRMPETVIGFAGVFQDEIVRRVAIIADGDTVMARFDPGIEMVLHNVAIGARGRIVREVRTALRINERVGPDADGKPHDSPCNDHSGDGGVHSQIPVSERLNVPEEWEKSNRARQLTSRNLQAFETAHQPKRVRYSTGHSDRKHQVVVGSILPH